MLWGEGTVRGLERTLGTGSSGSPHVWVPLPEVRKLRRQQSMLTLSFPLSFSSGFAVGPLTEASTGGPATPPWKECPICKERFPAESDKDAMEDHMDGHFFFSTQDPFTFE